MSAHSEFDLIARYFQRPVASDRIQLGIGDDCAVVQATRPLALSIDTLNAGVHFPHSSTPQDIARKAVAVNLSDLAAMGAAPVWAMLALSLPEADEAWLHAFSEALHAALAEHGVALVGGDTTQGSLSISLQVAGELAWPGHMRRGGACAGHRIYVTGTLGDAALGLQCAQNPALARKLDPVQRDFLLARLNRPEARLAFGQQLAAICPCAIDVSDGLLADLGHVLAASGCGARIEIGKLPLSGAARHAFARVSEGRIDWQMVLAHGDDYELCFTLPASRESAMRDMARAESLPVHCIGEITGDGGLVLVDENGAPLSLQQLGIDRAGFDHFSDSA